MSDDPVTATQIVEWEDGNAEKFSILVVEDKSKSGDERKRLELTNYNEDIQEWRTMEVISNVSEFNAFGIPENFVN